MSLKTALQTGALCLMALTLQLTVFTQVRIAGVVPELLVLSAAIAGLTMGSGRGSLVAFSLGLLWDAYLSTPLGLSAVPFALAAYIVGSVEEGLFSNTRTQTVILVTAATAFSITLYALLGELVGQDGLMNRELPKIVMISSAANAALAVPAVHFVRLAARP